MPTLWLAVLAGGVSAFFAFCALTVCYAPGAADFWEGAASFGLGLVFGILSGVASWAAWHALVLRGNILALAVPAVIDAYLAYRFWRWYHRASLEGRL